MFLSFIVPAYNTESYLAECLDSLLEQDLPYNEYEIICINDGSTDNSLDVLKLYKKKYPNVTIIDKENQGVATARNVGLENAEGDYVWFIDSDDFVQANILAELKEIARKKAYDQIVTGFYCFNYHLTKDEQIKKETRELEVNSNQYDSVVITRLFRREFLRQNRIKFNYPDITHGEDTIFMYEFKLSLPDKIELNKPYYFHRFRNNSAMTGADPEAMKRKQLSYLHNAIIMKKYYDRNCGDAADTANYLMSFLWLELLSLAHMPLKEARKYMHELRQNGLFPFKRPDACTLIKSYQTTRTDWIGKLFETIYLNMHTRPGWWVMRFWALLERIKNMLLSKKRK